MVTSRTNGVWKLIGLNSLVKRQRVWFTFHLLPCKSGIRPLDAMKLLSKLVGETNQPWRFADVSGLVNVKALQRMAFSFAAAMTRTQFPSTGCGLLLDTPTQPSGVRSWGYVPLGCLTWGCSYEHKGKLLINQAKPKWFQIPKQNLDQIQPIEATRVFIRSFICLPLWDRICPVSLIFKASLITLRVEQWYSDLSPLTATERIAYHYRDQNVKTCGPYF